MMPARSEQPPNGKLIAHILPYPSVGGTELGTLRIMKAVEPLGIRSIAISLTRSDTVLDFFHEAGIPAIEWPAPIPSIRHGAAYWSASRALAAEFKRLGVSLVHCADFLAAFHTSLAGSLAGIPVLCHVRNRHDQLLFRDWLFTRPVTHFAFVSKNTWTRFSHSVPARKGTVVYDGIALPSEASINAETESGAGVKEEFGLPAACRLIGMIARVAPQKDFDTLVRAAVPVVAAVPDARFLIIGDNTLSHYQQVKSALAAAGISEYFIFTGYRQDTPRLLASLEISVLSTHFEGLPLALIESMAYGKPVVATAVDGVPELIEDGVDGLLCAHGDAEDMARKLILLLEDRPRAATMGRAARETVLSRFSAENFVASISALYLRLLA